MSRAMVNYLVPRVRNAKLTTPNFEIQDVVEILELFASVESGYKRRTGISVEADDRWMDRGKPKCAESHRQAGNSGEPKK